MSIHIIPEDFWNDQYILKRLFEGAFAKIGRQRTEVRICLGTFLGGMGEALKSERIGNVVERNGGMADVFILCVNRDGNRVADG